MPPKELTSVTQPAESSADIRARTIKAREVQLRRFQNHDPTTAAQGPATENRSTGNSTGTGQIFSNTQMGQKQIKEFCPLTDESRGLLHMAVEELGFSARAYDKILKVARTISDLAGGEDILPEHIAEAIQYRCLDRREWC